MTDRERRLVSVLAIFGALGIVFGVYQLLLVPLKAANADYQRFSEEFGEKDAKIEKARKELSRLGAAKKRSLPANLDLVQQKYQAALDQLLVSAGVPRGATVTPKDDGGTRSIPELAPKKPAYTRVGYDVRMQQVDMPMLAKFLQGYYSLKLMHQITHIEIKKSDKAAAATARRTHERADLDVTLHTEAIILDGAENRRTLEAVPTALAAIAGNLGFQAAHNTLDDRRITKPAPAAFQSLLAGGAVNSKETRDYLVMMAKDPFHGTLPIPPAPRVEAKEEVVVAPPKPKEDISPYIKLNGLTIGSTGIIEATLWDVANNHTYEVTVKPMVNGVSDVKVEKFFLLDGKRKRLEKWTELVINEENSSTDRKFLVKGIYQDGLVLCEKVLEEIKEPKAAAPAAPGIRRPSGARPEPAASKNPRAGAIAVAGAIAGLPPMSEKIWHWRVGQSLKMIQELPTGEKKVDATQPKPELVSTN